jgi:hypothetical protein
MAVSCGAQAGKTEAGIGGRTRGCLKGPERSTEPVHGKFKLYNCMPLPTVHLLYSSSGMLSRLL